MKADGGRPGRTEVETQTAKALSFSNSWHAPAIRTMALSRFLSSINSMRHASWLLRGLQSIHDSCSLHRRAHNKMHFYAHISHAGSRVQAPLVRRAQSRRRVSPHPGSPRKPELPARPRLHPSGNPPRPTPPHPIGPVVLRRPPSLHRLPRWACASGVRRVHVPRRSRDL